MVTQQPNRLGTVSYSRGGQELKVAFLKTEEDPKYGGDVTRVTLTSTEPYGRVRTRLVAVAEDGAERPSWISETGGPGSAVFNRPLSSIKEFRFEVRPFAWVEFSDTALEPTAARL